MIKSQKITKYNVKNSVITLESGSPTWVMDVYDMIYPIEMYKFKFVMFH